MLVRYDPFDEWDQFLEQVLAQGEAPRRVPIDAIRRGDWVEMSCELPGVDPASIVVTVDGDVLAIRAERVGAPGAAGVVGEVHAHRLVPERALHDDLVGLQLQPGPGEPLVPGRDLLPAPDVGRPRGAAREHEVPVLGPEGEGGLHVAGAGPGRDPTDQRADQPPVHGASWAPD